jgi:hypothetical protein
MRTLLIAVVLGSTLLACDKPDVHTADECKDAGGRVVPAPGSPAECASNEEKIGQIPLGIEGAICCRKR